MAALRDQYAYEEEAYEEEPALTPPLVVVIGPCGVGKTVRREHESLLMLNRRVRTLRRQRPVLSF